MSLLDQVDVIHFEWISRLISRCVSLCLKKIGASLLYLTRKFDTFCSLQFFLTNAELGDTFTLNKCVSFISFNKNVSFSLHWHVLVTNYYQVCKIDQCQCCSLGGTTCTVVSLVFTRYFQLIYNMFMLHMSNKKLTCLLINHSR